MIRHFIAILVCGLCIYSISCDNRSEDVPDFDREAFYAEKQAWESQNIDRYYLSLTHTLGSQTFTSHAQVTDDIPSYIETGVVSLVSTRADFPFPPLAETIDGIYKTVEEVWKKGFPITISYDSLEHTPKNIKITGYTENGTDYTLVVTFSRNSFETEEDDEDMDRKDDIVNFDMERFQNEKAAWEAQGITAYRFTRQMLLNMPVDPARITVKGNEELEIEVLPHNDNFTLSDIEMLALYGKTISEIYVSIEADIEKQRKKPRDEHNWVGVTLRYNVDYHFPEYYSMFFSHDDLPLPGGDIGFEISDFEVLDDIH